MQDDELGEYWTDAQLALMAQLYDEREAQAEAGGDWSGGGHRWADVPELDAGKIRDQMFRDVPPAMIRAATRGNESALAALRRRVGIRE